MVFEGAVIGDQTILGEGAIIQPGVKVWPDKEIETGATVSSSLIWGAQGRRALFGRCLLRVCFVHSALNGHTTAVFSQSGQESRA